MRAGRHPRRAHGSDDLPLSHRLPPSHLERGRVRVPRLDPASVTHDHEQPVAAAHSGERHDPGRGRRDRGPSRSGHIDPCMQASLAGDRVGPHAETRGDRPRGGPDQRSGVPRSHDADAAGAEGVRMHQPRPPSGEQVERVDVGAVALGAPVQMRLPLRQHAEHLPGHDHLAGSHRELTEHAVGGLQPSAVVEGHPATARHLPGERHTAAQRGMDRVAGSGRKVDPTVTRPVALRGRHERRDHRPGDRPHRALAGDLLSRAPLHSLASTRSEDQQHSSRDHRRPTPDHHSPHAPHLLARDSRWRRSRRTRKRCGVCG